MQHWEHSTYAATGMGGACFMSRKAILRAAVAALSFVTAFAPCQGAEEFPKTVATLDGTNAQFFVVTTLARQRAMSEGGTLLRIKEEKHSLYTNLCAQAAKEYGLLANKEYTWDEEDLTIYELLTEKTWRGERKKLKHRKFESAEAAKPAVAALAERFRLMVQYQVLDGLVKERSRLAGEADQAIRTRFKLDESGDYTFDVKTKTIIQTGVKEKKK